MERPSHIRFQTQHLSRRLPFFALAAFLQVGAVALIMTGLGHTIPFVSGPLHFVPDFKEEKTLPPPPPPPTDIKPVEQRVDIPIFTTAPPPDGTGIHVVTGPGPTEVAPVQPKPPTIPDHGAVAVMATHTQPPYPPIAIRQNLEGKVLLRLTVLETGRVGKAEVVTSSGSDTLDQAAQAWIVAHWAYRPALAGGQPVASQAMASVDFSLKNVR